MQLVCFQLNIIEKQWPNAADYMNKNIGSLFSGVQEGLREDTKLYVLTTNHVTIRIVGGSYGKCRYSQTE